MFLTYHPISCRNNTWNYSKHRRPPRKHRKYIWNVFIVGRTRNLVSRADVGATTVGEWNETKRNERTNERANKRKGSRWTRGLLPPGSRAKIVNSRDSRVIGGMCFQSVVERIRKGKAEQEKERRRQVVGVPEIPVTEPKPFYWTRTR